MAGEPSTCWPLGILRWTPACAHDHAVADLSFILDPRLSGHDHVVAGRATAGDADLPAKQVVPADLVVVADHHQVVDLGPLTDPGCLEGRPVDRAIGADLDVATDLQPTRCEGS